MRKLIIKNYQVPCWIGILPAEKLAPQPIILNFELTLSPHRVREDHIAATVDYSFVHDQVPLLLADRHFSLQETLVEALADLCFAQAGIQAVVIRCEKPTAYTDFDSVGYELSTSRADWLQGAR